MKKNKLLCLLLAFMITLQMFALPAWAAPEDGDETEETSGTGQSGPTDSSDATTAPTVFVIPENITGDASVSMGSHSIDAKKPLASEGEYENISKAALLYEMNSDTLLYGANIDEKLYPASMTKVMTCLLALEMGDLDEMITVTWEALENFDLSGSAAGLIIGEEMDLENLLYCLMVASANDAAMVIADHLCGSEAAFVEKMNEKARELGCTNTHFANSHGLHDEEHYTTARDMAKIMLAAMEYDLFQELYSTSYYEVPATNESDVRKLNSTNYMLSETVLQDYYDGRVIGGKTGFTTPAGRCLVSVSQYGDMQVLCVLLGAGKAVEDVEGTPGAYAAFEETSDLLDFAFYQYEVAQVLTPDLNMKHFDVNGGETGTQGKVLESSLSLVKDGSDLSALQYQYELTEGQLLAPIAQDQHIGVVRVWHRGSCIAQQDLYAATPVAKQTISVQNGGNDVNPASPLPDGIDIWHIVLMVILGLLILILAMVVISRIRRAMYRARRRRYHRVRRNSQQTPRTNTRSNSRGTDRRRRP